MLSLKELILTELKDNNNIREPDWYIAYKNNLMKFLEKAYIDKIYGSNCFRIIIDYGDEQDESMLVHFVGHFVPKNNDDSDSDDYKDYQKIANKFKENDLSDSDYSDEELDAEIEKLKNKLRNKNVSE